MIVSEADAAALPSYNTYRLGNAVLRPLIERLGGYVVHNAEALRPLDGESYILAPNHRSNWDSIALGLAMMDLPDLSQAPQAEPLQPRAIHFMAKDTLWRYPGLRHFLERCGAFPVQRNRGVGLQEHQVDHIAGLIGNGAVMCIYPQGHRERGPEDEESLDPAKFKTSIAWLALAYGVPVVPVGIAGPVKGRKLPRTLVFDEPIHTERANPEDESFTDRKYALMRHLHARVNRTYGLARELHDRLGVAGEEVSLDTAVRHSERV